MDTKQIKESFAEHLRESRAERGISQIELQKQTGVNIWRLENGRIDPSLSTLHTLARALGISVEELVKEVE